MDKVIDVSGGKIKLIKQIAEKSDSLIFLDPPYYPVPKTKGGKISLNNLYNGPFTPTDFLKLRCHCDDLTRERIPFILTNSDCEFIRILFKGYPIVEIKESHELKKSNRGEKNYKADCVIITNYKNEEHFMGGIKKINELKRSKEQ